MTTDTPPRPSWELSIRGNAAPAATDLLLDELQPLLQEQGLFPYRARQVFRWAHGSRAAGWDDLSDLPKSFREKLASVLPFRALIQVKEQRSADGTVKLLMRTADGQQIETVHIPARSSESGDERLTVCVSSQAGCALACRFCATGQMGFGRNLSPGEIVEQVYSVGLVLGGRRPDNVVFMGMGEPLSNYDNVVKAVRLLADAAGFGLSPRRVTVSTSGLVPEIRRLTREDLGVRLAISLHAPTNELRSELMPINRRYRIQEVVEAAQAYAEASGRRASFEYVLLYGINDRPEQARQLVRLLHGRHAHVNLIPYNETASGYTPTPAEGIRAFAQILRTENLPCSIRASRGRDIAAACGQLKVEAARG
jgi:23S rRNA (adenine2503-C2)-methyltransferase